MAKKSKEAVAPVHIAEQTVPVKVNNEQFSAIADKMKG